MVLQHAQASHPCTTNFSYEPLELRDRCFIGGHRARLVLTPLLPSTEFRYLKAGDKGTAIGSLSRESETAQAALLVLIGGLADGRKVVLAVESGQRESTESWALVLRDLVARGLRAPACVVGDGALGLWGAVAQVWPTAAEQRCWNHKLRNVVDAVPRKQQAAVLAAAQRIAAAESGREAERQRQAFHRAVRLRDPKASERLDRDWARMLTYYTFPKEHGRHLRTTNVVESPFAAVRLRTTAAKRFKKVEHATAIIWRLLRVAEHRFRKLNAPEQCHDVFHGTRYEDGVAIHAHPSVQKDAA